MKACVKLHRELVIRETGKVYPCCNTDRVVGDTKQQSLDDIWHSRPMESLRQLNISGALPCMKECVTGQHNLADPKRVIEMGTPVLRDLMIIIGIFCNIRCVMCFQNQDRERFGNSLSIGLSADLLINQIDFRSLGEVMLQGGEPMVIPEARKLFFHIANMESPSPYVNLTTNGLVLPDSMIRAIVQHSRFHYISLNAATKGTHETVNVGSSWERVITNVRRLQDERDRTGSKLRIIGCMTIVPQNIFEVGHFIRMSKEFGFDGINLNYDKSTVPSMLEDVHLKEKIAQEVAEAIAAEENTVGIMGEYKLRKLGLLT